MTETTTTAMQHNRRKIEWWPLVVALLLTGVSAACRRDDKPVRTYVALPATGWRQDVPITFNLQDMELDSTAHYDVTLSLRHDNDYRFANLSLVVDLLDADGQMKRHRVELPLSDNYGSWKGSGFGAFYQVEMPVAHDVLAKDLCHVVVWQVMDSVAELGHIDQLGLLLVKSNRK